MSQIDMKASSFALHPQVTVIGGGSWGTAIARLVAGNLRSLSNKTVAVEGHSEDSNIVRLWMREETVCGEQLSDIVNTRHENVQYLPGVTLPDNVVATGCLSAAIAGATVLIFAVPHQFLRSVLLDIISTGLVSRKVIGVSLIKGVEVHRDPDQSAAPVLMRFSNVIQQMLGLDHIVVAMGANIAMDIARDQFAETTVACIDLNIANFVAHHLFQNEHFDVQISRDVSTVEFCGALKNIVALGAGLCDGINMEMSTKAAVIRQGLEEMTTFCDVFDQTNNFEMRTLFLSCGVADLIATCFGGRNRKCAEEYARQSPKSVVTMTRSFQFDQQIESSSCEIWQQIEERLLNGQKLQGVSTCYNINNFLELSGYLESNPTHFPLFQVINKIVSEGEKIENLFHRRST